MFFQVLDERKKPKPLISVDYDDMVAIKTSGGLEERKKLEHGTGGVCHCTWDDGTVYQSDVPVLFLTCPRASILAMKVSKKRPASALLKKPAAAKPDEEEDEDDEEEQDGEDEDDEDEEEDEDDEEDEEGEEEEQKDPDELEKAEGPAKKAKPAGEEHQDSIHPRHIKGSFAANNSMRQGRMCT